ncbi:MAG TPA: hypothetical protein VGH20_09215 [Myxococcales bacterium]|jgi:hypothetical protein
MKNTLTKLLFAMVLCAGAARAQTAVSSFTVPVSGTANPLPVATSTAATAQEPVAVSGNVILTAAAVTDPVLPPGVALTVDGNRLKGVGTKTGAAYRLECEAVLTRPLNATDTVQVTFALFKDVPNGHLAAQSAMLSLNLTYDTVKMALTQANGSIASVPAVAVAPTPTPIGTTASTTTAAK